MARLPRLSIPGHPHYVLQRGRVGKFAFNDDIDRRHYLHVLRMVAADLDVQVHGYALLSDTVHILLTPRKADSVGKLMQKVGQLYAKHFNARNGGAGTVWNGRYRAAVLQPEHFLLDCLRHMEMAAVRRGLALKPQEWRWSSAAHHAGHSDDPLVTEHAMYWTMGNTPFARNAAYVSLLEEHLPAAASAAIEHAVNGGWVIGRPGFIASLGRDTNRPLTPRRAGRKPKGGL